MDPLQTLTERGFVRQCTDPEALGRLLAEGPVTFYCGFDPTASSLHAGGLIPLMAMAHLQRAGHRPIAVVGGGTALVGDPSGKTELRQMLARETVAANVQGIRAQVARLLRLEGDAGLCVDNAEWLEPLRYIDFLREIGRHFRVNEMLRAESYRLRLEREEGLSFLEFNYQLLQAYDYLVLQRRYGCCLQLGGDDQWGNIVAGVDLVRRLDARQVFGLTFPLLLTASGEKMGKTATGAVWLDAGRTSPYEFYQYWINCDDRDVERFLALFTFLPMEDIRSLGRLQGADLRRAKEVLACEVTSLVHGPAAAETARAASHAAFGGAAEDVSAIPATSVPRARLEEGLALVELLCLTGLTPSRGAARRLIAGGGAYLNGEKVEDTEFVVRATALDRDGALLLRYGKKRYHRVVAV
jgi:tyrosyl-tRNA synthetase